MYYEILTAAVDIQKGLAHACDTSEDKRDLRAFYIVVTDLIAQFFQKIDPPEGCEALHESFVAFLEKAKDATLTEFERGHGLAPQEQALRQASERFLDEMKNLEVSSAA